MDRLNELEKRYRECLEKYQDRNLNEEYAEELLKTMDEINKELDILLRQDTWRL